MMCGSRGMLGLDMRRRLEELNEQANQSAKAVEHEIQQSSDDAA
jgi:hypothetical protein